MARITNVNKAQKDQGPCGRCGEAVLRGQPYRHASPGFRARKLVRCMKPGCAFRPSDLTTSKMSEVYAAQEDAEDTISAATCLEDIEQALEDAAGRAEEVAQEYRDAAEALGGAGEENAERADEIDSWVQELQGWDKSEFEVDPDDLDADPEDTAHLDDARESAVELLGSLSL